MSFIQNKPCATYDDAVFKETESSLKIEWLNSDEAANLLKISKQTLMNLTSNGKLPFYKFGRRNRYRKDELNQVLLNERRGHYGN